MKKILVGTLFAGLISSNLMAGANTQTGCGLGSTVIQHPDSAILYALQATTNGTSANQTFGITSGTSNCQRANLVMNERVEEFVASNMDSLHREISMGKGENLDTLAELLGEEDNDNFKSNLQANYLAIYNNDDVNMANTLDNIKSL